jgi:alpha-tubulin suppressor-like RCC1 family protein
VTTQEGWATNVVGSITTPEIEPAVRVYGGTSGATTTTSVPVACAILTNGTAACWGDNTYGEILAGTGVTSVSAPTVIPGATSVVAMAFGRTPLGSTGGFMCLAEQGAGVYCAGGPNTQGVLGNGTALASPNALSPVQGLQNVVELAAGVNHVCARRADGSVACWGNNDYGQLGNGTKTTQFAPVTVGAW